MHVEELLDTSQLSPFIVSSCIFICGFSLLKWPPNLVEYFAKSALLLSCQKLKAILTLFKCLDNARYRDGGNN